MAAFPELKEADARAWIGQYGLQGSFQERVCKTLSGGQKSRVAFAMLAYRLPHLMVMDEPTNHLDLETSDALADALVAFTGAVLAVSHDQHFVQKVCNRIWT